MIKNKSVRFSGSDEENNGRKRRWRLFRRNKAAPEPEELSDNPLMSDKYSKFTEEDPTDSMPRKMAVHPRAKTKKDFKPRKEVFLSAPPAARQAAFGGPPRYDWIDIVSSSTVIRACRDGRFSIGAPRKLGAALFSTNPSSRKSTVWATVICHINTLPLTFFIFSRKLRPQSRSKQPTEGIR